jgi:hypothetical protein
MTEKQEQKIFQYATMIASKISELLNEDSDLSIDPDELDEYATEFIHAMATVAPLMLYNNLTGDNQSALGFNHIANQLCFQYLRPVSESNDTDGEK